jgi:citrate synthase
MSRDTLTVTNNQTGESFDIPIEGGAIRADALTDPFRTDRGPGLVIYDPGFANTASCRSAITNIHIESGVLEHRGYRIETLCEHASAQLERWQDEIRVRKFVHENVKNFFEGFRYDAHPMAMLAGSVGAIAEFYADSGDVMDEAAREVQILRLVAKMPTLAAYAYRHGAGMPYVLPADDLSYPGNLLSMMFKMSELRYAPDPRIERALEVLMIVHADHEQSAATTAVRAVGSTHVSPYAAVAAGVAALSGPMRGMADREVLHMLQKVGSVEAVTDYLERVKAGDELLMGFGHWVYKAYDPRARILRSLLDQLSEVRPLDPLVAIADELARQALDDEYFTSRRLFPNVDLYSGLTYRAIGIPQVMFGVMFATARSAGWLAQWLEMVKDAEQSSVRPRQLYIGANEREWVPLAQRS